MNLRLQAAGYDVVTLDTAADRAASRESLGAAQCVQGNLDPRLLLAGDDAAPGDVDARLAARGGGRTDTGERGMHRGALGGPGLGATGHGQTE